MPVEPSPVEPAAVPLLGVAQPPLRPAALAEARGALLRYRVMAVVTGVVLLFGTVELIVKYAADVNPPIYGAVWIVHGWLYVVYVIVTGLLGLRLRWPLARYALVMLAGTIPTASFLAERAVTRAAQRSGAEVAR